MSKQPSFGEQLQHSKLSTWNAVPIKQQPKKFQVESIKKSTLPEITAKPKRSKNAPMEITSKKSVTRNHLTPISSAPKFRDPRFDSMSGQFNKGLFESSYSFLEDLKKEELNVLKQNRTENFDQIQLLQSKNSVQKKNSLLRDAKKSVFAKEREMISKGKTPYFEKKSVIKQRVQIDEVITYCLETYFSFVLSYQSIYVAFCYQVPF